ncbi:MAG TPA: DegT/DnrJ/EryC1/StrS family aminotransferase, partial [Fervidobacterium sp.]|nr:DegT/DnrJ/EryC1/StrS family aminotransferase [Fervidobacterium sp.]
MPIQLDAPNIGELEKQYLNRCIDSTFVSTFGPFIGEFEDKFARYVGTKRAVSTQSGTAAIHLALH